MSKDHEQFLLKCELAKSMLMRVWAKGLITDEEMKESMERIVEKLKAEENKKSIKNNVRIPSWARNYVVMYQNCITPPCI